ncbi:MAG: ATP-binding protein, partial [Planctomycetia bacterium]
PWQGQRVFHVLLAVLRQRGYSEDEIFGIRTAVEEAVVNAIRHGNGLDPNKFVRVGFSVSEQHLVIEVADEGNGFQPEAVPDPRLPQNLCRPTGRGLLLMRSFMTECQFLPPGNICRMRRVRKPA